MPARVGATTASRFLRAVVVAAAVAGCGDALPSQWPPGYYCGVGDSEKDMGGADGADAGTTTAGGAGTGTGTWAGAIVNGQAEPDPAVAPLTDTQQLAVGAMVGRWGGSFCTGTLVGDNAVLTAAHCLEGRPASDTAFAIGRDSARPVHTFRCSEVHVNPGYRGGPEHDNAVCVLAGSFADEYPDVTPIDYNTEPLEGVVPAFVGRDVQNVGYGSTEPGGGGSNTLRWWTVEEVISLERLTYQVNGHGYSAVCFGDSGGPTLMTFPDGTVRVIGSLHGGNPSCTEIDTFARTDADAAWLATYVVPARGCRWGLAGRCNGDVAEWCVGEEEGDLRTVDCAAWGRICGLDAGGLHRCLTTGWRCPEGLTYEGLCAPGDVAVWCQDRLVRRRHCRPCGQVCRRIDAEIGHYCAEPI